MTPHTYITGESQKSKVDKLLLLEIEVKNGKFKGNRGGVDASDNTMPVLHSGSGGSGERAGNDSLGPNDSVDTVLGVCSPYGLAMYRLIRRGCR